MQVSCEIIQLSGNVGIVLAPAAAGNWVVENGEKKGKKTEEEEEENCKEIENQTKEGSAQEIMHCRCCCHRR